MRRSVRRQARPRGRVVLTPSGRRVAVDDEGSEVLELTEQGFYEVSGQAGDADVAVVASNVDPGGIGPDGDGSEGNRRGGDRWAPDGGSDLCRPGCR